MLQKRRGREKRFGVKGREKRWGGGGGEDSEEGEDKVIKNKYEMYIGIMIRIKIEETKKRKQ